MKFGKSNRSNTLATLATVPMFTDCHRRDLRLIDSSGTVVDVDAGRVLCREGRVGDECFVVLYGNAYVTMNGRWVSTVGRGALIGEIALLSLSSRRVATVIAQTPMSLFVFGRREFGYLVRTTPGLAERLVHDVSERLSRLLLPELETARVMSRCDRLPHPAVSDVINDSSRPRSAR